MPSLSHFRESDAARTRALLARICGAPELHARFLNTLSLLEHIGSRKIMASQARKPGGMMDVETLKHLAEETRHAFFFKRAAEGVAGAPLSYTGIETLAGVQARLYMGRLDAFIARAARGPAAYLYMSLVVELRATWFYQIYQDALRQARQPLKLAGILAEEQGHLDEMGGRLTALDEELEERMPAFMNFEGARFGHFLTALENSIVAS